MPRGSPPIAALVWTGVVNLLIAWFILPGLHLGMYSVTSMDARRTMQKLDEANAISVETERTREVLNIDGRYAVDSDSVALALIRPLEQYSFNTAATITLLLSVESVLLFGIAFAFRERRSLESHDQSP